MHTTIIFVIESSTDLSNIRPISTTVTMNKYNIKFNVQLNKTTHMLVACLKIIASPIYLEIEIKYALEPLFKYRRNCQNFIYTNTNKRSDPYILCRTDEIKSCLKRYRQIQFKAYMMIKRRDCLQAVRQFNYEGVPPLKDWKFWKLYSEVVSKIRSEQITAKVMILTFLESRGHTFRCNGEVR